MLSRLVGFGSSVVCVFDCWVIRRLRVRHPLGRQHSFVEIDHELFSTVILSFPLIKKGSCQFLAKLSVSGERMCTILLTA